MAALSEVPLAASMAKRKFLPRRVRAAPTTLPHSSSRMVARTSGCSWISLYIWFVKASSPRLNPKIVAAGRGLVSGESAPFTLVDCPSGHDGLEHGALLIQEHEVGVATDGDSPFAIQDHCRRRSLRRPAHSPRAGAGPPPSGGPRSAPQPAGIPPLPSRIIAAAGVSAAMRTAWARETPRNRT